MTPSDGARARSRLISESRPGSAEETQLYRPDMTAGGAGLFLKCPVVFALEWPGQIRDCGRMPGKREVIPKVRVADQPLMILLVLNRSVSARPA